MGYATTNPYTNKVLASGTKRSGYGREMGPEGIREFTNVKVINGTGVRLAA